MIDPTPTASAIPSKRSLLGLLFGYWPWTKEIAKETTEEWETQHHVHGIPIGEPTGYVRHTVTYRITNRYTGSVTLRKDYLD